MRVVGAGVDVGGWPAEAKLASGIQPQRRMGRGDHQTAVRQVSVHDAAQPLLRGRVECRRRLVEEPDRPGNRQQPGERETPPLSGRQITGRKIGKLRQAGRLQAAIDSRGVEHRASVEESRPKRQIFHHGQRRLMRIEVTEVVRLFGHAQFAVAAIEREMALGW